MPDLIRQAAKDYAEAPTATIILALGMNRPGRNVEAVKAAVNLALVTGRVGKESCGVHLFGEKANSQGAVDMGMAPDLLPGFVGMTTKRHERSLKRLGKHHFPRKRASAPLRSWPKSRAGRFEGFTWSERILLRLTRTGAQVEKALGKLEFLVVQDMFLTSTASMAHAVLPVASFAEKSGRYTSAERLVQRLRPVLKPPLREKATWKSSLALAALMGKPSMTYAGPEQVMAEIARLVDVYRGFRTTDSRTGRCRGRA